MEEIVGIKFTEDSIEYPEITLNSLNEGGIPFPGDTDTFYAPDTDIKVLYDISIEALKSSECYSENWGSISDQNKFDNYICDDLNYLEKNYGIETNMVHASMILLMV